MRRLSTWLLLAAVIGGGFGGWQWWSAHHAGLPESTLKEGLPSDPKGFKQLDANSEILKLLDKAEPEAYVDFAMKQSACPQVTLPQSLPHRALAAYYGRGGTLIEVIYSGSKSDIRDIWRKVKQSRLDCKAVTLPSGIASFGFTMSPETIAPMPRLIETPGYGSEGGIGGMLGTNIATALIGDEVIVTFIWTGDATLTALGVKERTRALRLLTKTLGLPRTAGPGAPIPVG